MVDSALPARPRRHPRRRAIATRNPSKRPRTARRAKAATTPAAKPARKPATTARRTKKATRPRAEQPLGAGVGDAFAVRRLMKTPPRRGPKDGVREIGWAEFGAIATTLAEEIARGFQPHVVLGVANAGVFVGGALAPALRAELVHLHLPGRGGDGEKLPSLAGKRVLVVDDAADSGRTLARACALAKKARAAEVRTAVIVLRPGGARPDWHAIETADVAVFGWDYQFHGGAVDGDPGDTGV